MNERRTSHTPIARAVAREVLLDAAPGALRESPPPRSRRPLPAEPQPRLTHRTDRRRCAGAGGATGGAAGRARAGQQGDADPDEPARAHALSLLQQSYVARGDTLRLLATCFMAANTAEASRDAANPANAASSSCRRADEDGHRRADEQPKVAHAPRSRLPSQLCITSGAILGRTGSRRFRQSWKARAGPASLHAATSPRARRIPPA